MVKALKTAQGKVLTLNGDVLTTTAIVPTGTLSITADGTYDVTNYASAVVSAGSSGKYALFDRVTDDSNNVIGTVSGFFTDANDVEYAVVCLDAQYRGQKGFSSTGEYWGLTQYPDLNVLECKDTATYNTTAIIASGQVDDAATYCRTQSFTIDGTTYYGQLPNCKELVDMWSNATALDTYDTTSSDYAATRFIGLNNRANSFWASNANPSGAWQVGGDIMKGAYQGYSYVACPVLEIPNQ